MSDGLKAKHRAAIIATLAANNRVERAVLFGSRAMGTNTITSDVDIALFGQHLTLTDQASLAAACEELPMAQSVDLVLHSAIDNPALVEHIRSYGVEWYRRGGSTVVRGDMGSQWCECTLGDVITLKRGYDLPKRMRKVGNIPVVSSSGVSDYHNKAMVKGPGVATGRYGTIGNVYYIEQDFFPLNTSLYVQDFKSNDPRFISYYLKTINYLSCSDKAAVPGVNRNHLHSLKVNIPPLSEQKSIAHILGTLDDKIELNRRMNETLEAMARALFKDWFVDFGPVRAKAEGREAYLPEEIWGLFPDSFEDSELGEIPRGWGVCSVGDLLTLERHSTTPGDTSDEIFSHYSIPAFDNGMLPAKESGGTIKSNKYLVGDRVFLVSKLNPRTPRIWLPSTDDIHKKICSTEFLVCRPSSPIGIPFGYCLAKSDSIVQQMSDLASGTSNSHQRVRPADFTCLSVVRPDNKLLSLFNQQILPLLHKSLQIREEKFLMGECRDVLLPKLISGEIHVGEAEKVAEMKTMA